MKILAVHNRYSGASGEDQSHLTEIRLLQQQNHIVDEYIDDNTRIAKLGLVKTSIDTVWSQDSYLKIKKLLHSNQYDLMIVQNPFPLLSPSIYYAAKSEQVPVVQFLRNYRLFCLNAFALRNNKPCEDCLKKSIPWPGIYHACYRKSHAASAVVASMLVTHRLLKTWQRKVDAFVALTTFSKNLFIQAGLPAEKLFIKPNFVYPDPGIGNGAGGYALFVGRLSEEKGIETLLRAWGSLAIKIRLKIAGDGPLTSDVENAAQLNPSIEYLGKQSPAQVFDLMKNAMFLLFPSICYEGMPRTVIESFATGTPVLASEMGAMREMIIPERNGLFFNSGDPIDLASKITRLALNESKLTEMRRWARSSYETQYTIDQSLIIWNKIQDAVFAGQKRS